MSSFSFEVKKQNWACEKVIKHGEKMPIDLTTYSNFVAAILELKRGRVLKEFVSLYALQKLYTLEIASCALPFKPCFNYKMADVSNRVHCTNKMIKKKDTYPESSVVCQQFQQSDFDEDDALPETNKN